MQAIITRFLGPTNFRGSRYKASCDAGTIIVSADHGLNAEQNHIAARAALCCKIAKANHEKYGKHGHDVAKDPWLRPMVCGQIPSGEYVHVFAEA